MLRPLPVVLAAQGTALGCFGVAMALYPGGAQHDPAATGHSFWLNYLCDLTDAHGRNGAVNEGAVLGRLGMAAVLVALAALFTHAPRVFASRRLGALVRGAGALCVLATCGVPLSAWLALQWLHDVSILTAGPLGLVAAAGVVLGLRPAPVPTMLGALALGGALVALGIYAGCLALGTSTVLLPVAQRIAVILTFAWILASAADVHGRLRDAAHRGASVLPQGG